MEEDDLPVLSISSSRAAEGDYVDFIVRLSEAGIDAITVDYRTRSGALNVGDGVDGTLTFLAGQTEQTFRVYVGSDGLDERDENFLLELTNAVGASFGGTNRSLTAVGWALDQDGAGSDRAIAVSAPVLTEGAGAAARFTVSLSEAFGSAQSFTFSTYDLSARAGSDYVARAGTVTFAAGQTEAVVQVALLDDRLAEAGESFGLRINGAAGVGGAVGEAQILDDDAALPVLSLEGSAAAEGDYVQFVVRLSEPATDAVTVEYATRSGSELVGDGTDGQLTFLVGETEKTVEIYVGSDSVDEVDKHLALELTNAVGASFGATNRSLTATGWALDQDGAGSNRALAVSAPVVAEGAGGTARFVVSLSEPAASATSFTYATYDMSARAGSDYVARAGTVTFAAGQTEAVVEVALLNDRLAEAGESFGLRVVGSGTVAGAAGEARVLDDDAPRPVLSIEGAGSAEGDYVQFVVRLSKPASDAVSVDYMTRSGSLIVSGSSNSYNDTLTFAAGETAKTVTVYVGSDSLDEIDQSFALELTNAVGASFGATNRSLTATGWALDQDGPGSNRALAVSAPVLSEGAGGVARFEVTLSQAATAPLSFAYSTYDLSARAGSDYAARAGTVTFAAGQTKAIVEVPLGNDMLAEGAESFGLRVRGAGTVTGATGEAQILNEDGPVPVLSLEGGRAAEGDYIRFVARLSEPARNAVTADYTVRSGTTTDGEDVSNASYSGELVFAAGETEKSFNVYVGGDSLDEIDEHFSVALSNPVGAIFGGSNRSVAATGWALDADGVANNRAVAVSSPVVGEAGTDGAGTAVFWIELSQASAAPITLDYRTIGQTAVAGQDFVAAAGSVTFAAGQTRAAVSVRLAADLVREGTETFALRILPPYPSAIAGSLGLTQGMATVMDRTILGTAGNDVRIGTAVGDVIDGLGGNDRLYGLGGSDLLRGGAGNDLLDGGVGIDRMAGELGNDVYVIDHVRDVAIEGARAGIDTVRSSVSHALAVNVENLLLTGAAGAGTGNGLANVLIGTVRANLLNGAAGNDRVSGGGGSDRLLGAAGNDQLDGGLGVDRMAGGLGNDVYVVDHVRDVVLEGARAGTDLVRSSVSFALGANLENLLLTGTAAAAGTGNAAANVLFGNAGANRLSGGAGADRLSGGLGADALLGGAGADDFVFTSAAAARGDRIGDFVRGQDQIDLRAFDADVTRRGVQDFHYVGSGPLEDAGDLRFARGLLTGDLNGDGRADFAVGVTGLSALSGLDFLL